ncbi:MAG: hypothetical protein L3K03_05955 [Thermoplasmata archaeon]|nr:hypothetical protein [Thermoplasmata archaeon]
MARCPFCGAAETDRVSVEGLRYIVFACMFTPQVNPSIPEEQIEGHLRATYGTTGDVYFRRQCDLMHLFVTKGAGGRVLTRADAPEPTTVPPGA